jgi:insertion element IS1 protein InsB
VNKVVVEGCCPDAITVEIRRVEAAEVDEMWSFVQNKGQQRWLWHAIDHLTGVVLAYTFGSRADEVFVKLQKLLKPFGLEHFYTDAAGVYDRYLPASTHTVGKRHTQQIERKHLTLRTRIKRLARKTICFSKSVLMHDTVIGLFVNRYEFGTLV